MYQRGVGGRPEINAFGSSQCTLGDGTRKILQCLSGVRGVTARSTQRERQCMTNLRLETRQKCESCWPRLACPYNIRCDQARFIILACPHTPCRSPITGEIQPHISGRRRTKDSARGPIAVQHTHACSGKQHGTPSCPLVLSHIRYGNTCARTLLSQR